MWICPRCGRTAPEKPESMTCRCGLTLTSRETVQKHQTLEKICSSNPYGLLIDACAGSGIIEDPYEEGLRDGSPLIMARVAKKKSPPARCIFIESSRQTYWLLWRNTVQHRDISKPILGDCNELLQRLVEESDAPVFIYIDPFGYGNPPIDREVVVKISQNPRVDLLISFMWRITRQMGYVREYIDSDNYTLRRRAESYRRSLAVYWGSLECLRWPSMSTWQYAERYAHPLRKYNTVEIIGIPPQSRSPSYLLILATKFKVPPLPYRLDRWFRSS